MSQVKVQGNASGTGVFTIAAPSGNTDRTLTLPDSAGTIATSESVAASGYATAASTLTQFNASGSAPVYACRAWVNFNGNFAGNMTLANGGIRASGNVSSITDNGTGDYTINFTTAMQDANYSAVATLSRINDGYFNIMYKNDSRPITTTQVSFLTKNNLSSLEDEPTLSVAIFR